MLKQTVGWGVGQALVYRKHQHLMRRDSWQRLAADYRRIAGLTKLTVGRWLSVRSGRQETEDLEDAYLSLIYFGGIKLGRLKGSVRGRVFYP
jgi:hypothetical protein